MNALNPYRHGMSLRSRRSRWLHLALLLGLLLPGAAFAAAPTILVEHFDFFDTSIDQRPMMIAAQNRWLTAADAALRQELASGGQLSVVDTAQSKRLLADIAGDYQHPSTCRSCALTAASKLGARYMFIGSIHKISDLICYMRGELDDVRTGKVLLVKNTEVKADNKTMWLRATHAMAESIKDSLANKGAKL